MIVSVDLGYGYVKAVNNQDDKKIIFPSVIAPGGEDMFEGNAVGLDLNGLGHSIEMRSVDSISRNRLYIGDLATMSRGAQITLSRDKFNRDVSLSFAMTAAYLAGAEDEFTLAIGLPLAYYKKQKEDAKNALEGMSIKVTVNSGKEKQITFKNVLVYPQAVGALFYHTRLPREGLIGIVDIGYYTTDYLLAKVSPGNIIPLSSYSSSVEVGMHTALKLFANKYTDNTGKPLDLLGANKLWDKETSRRHNVDVDKIKEIAGYEAGRTIGESISNAWSEQMDFIDTVFLTGGGALEFYPILKDQLEITEMMGEPQFANALGFLNMAKLQIQSLRRVNENGKSTAL